MLVAMLPVRNEADRLLRRVLAQLVALADAIVVFDDASTDATAQICEGSPKVQIYRCEQPRLAVDGGGPAP